MDRSSVIGVRVNEREKAALAREAEAEDRPISSMIRILMLEALLTRKSLRGRRDGGSMQKTGRKMG